jgi:hypothetical protein
MQITKNIHALKIPFQMVDPSGKRFNARGSFYSSFERGIECRSLKISMH